MVVEVTENKVIITESSVVNANEVCVNKCRFSLPDSFKGLVVTAIFNGIPVPVVDNACYIPSLEEGNVVLGVYAYKEVEGEVQLMYSPKPAIFYVSQGSFCENLNEEAVVQISQYEQYCKMIADKYTAIEECVEKAEADRQNAEISRQNAFLINEKARQKFFSTNEAIRQAEFEGAYTNLLKNVVEEIPTENLYTTLPAQLPCKKKGAFYSASLKKFQVDTDIDAYIVEVSEGERFNISDYTYIYRANTFVVDEDWTKIIDFTKANSNALVGGMYAMPENAKYLILHSPAGSAVPYITKVSEPVITTKDVSVPFAQKFIAPQARDGYHLGFNKTGDGVLLSQWLLDASDFTYTKGYASGVYPLECGKEYVLCYNDSEIVEYGYCGFICSDDFTINKIIQKQHLDACARYAFTAAENDKYIALNCFDFDGNIQFGENKTKGIIKTTRIGDAIFDGKNDITLNEIGGVSRSLIDKKWVSYGDSITWGTGVNYNDGEKRWQDYILERYNISSHINMGVGSTSVAHRENESYPSMCTDSRLNNLIAERPDIVTILGGANDLSYGIPIGTDEDVANKNKSTFKGAYALIIDKILSAKPDTIILALGMYFSHKENQPHKAYATATKEVAEHFGLPFVDLNECGFNSYNFNDKGSIFSIDGVHPNGEGVKRIAMVVSRWFDTFRGTIY